jgi:hypothetical protein
MTYKKRTTFSCVRIFQGHKKSQSRRWILCGPWGCKLKKVTCLSLQKKKWLLLSCSGKWECPQAAPTQFLLPWRCFENVAAIWWSDLYSRILCQISKVESRWELQNTIYLTFTEGGISWLEVYKHLEAMNQQNQLIDFPQSADIILRTIFLKKLDTLPRCLSGKLTDTFCLLQKLIT